jgi:hypothetical protein
VTQFPHELKTSVGSEGTNVGWKTLIAGAVMVLFAATSVQAAPATKAAPAAKSAATVKPAPAAASATPAATKAVHHHKHHRKHHRHHGMKAEATAGAYASPKQPVAYALLDAYMKASPKERASRDWSGGPVPMTASQAPMTPAPTATQDAPPPSPPTATSDTSVPPSTAPPATP